MWKKSVSAREGARPPAFCADDEIGKSASIAEKQVQDLCCPAAVRGARLGKKATGKTGKAQDPRDEPSQKARV